MLTVNETDLVFAFPDVDEEAILCVHFCRTDSPSQRIGIKGNPGSPLRLAAEGPFVLYLQPTDARRDCMYHSLRYPFALLVSVAGKNAIKCEPIYEDICNIGSWDKEHEEHAVLWVGGEI